MEGIAITRTKYQLFLQIVQKAQSIPLILTMFYFIFGKQQFRISFDDRESDFRSRRMLDELEDDELDLSQDMRKGQDVSPRESLDEEPVGALPSNKP